MRYLSYKTVKIRSMTHSCLNCQGDFKPARRNNRYCSQSCRQQAYIKRNWTKVASEPANSTNPGFAGISGLLENPEVSRLLGLLAGLGQNPSMTDKLTDPPEKPVNAMFRDEKTSQTVNDGLVNKPKKEGFTQKNAYEEYLNEKKSTQTAEKSGTYSVFQTMLANKLTISIPPNGYTRSLFPHWNDKEWQLTKYVNQKLVQLFEQLRTASYKSEISRQQLIRYLELTAECCEGSIAFCLPADYPFKPFIHLLYKRIDALLANTKEKKRFMFRLPDSLSQMMEVIKIQLGV